MNKWNKYLLLSLVLWGGFSCEKQEQEEPQVETKKETVLYSASSSIESFDKLGNMVDSEDDLRATITGQGYTNPNLQLTKDEFTRAYFGIIGNNKAEKVEEVTTVLDARPKVTDNITDNCIFIEQKTGVNGKPKTFISMYSQVDQYLNTDNSFAWLTLDGKVENEKIYYDKVHGTDPNALIKGLKNEDKDAGRHFPIMTDIMPFAKVYPDATKETLSFKARGVLVGLCFINKFNEPIKIKEIVLAADNALAFEGSFDYKQDMASVSYAGKSSTGQEEGKAMKFTSSPLRYEYTYPVAQDANAQLSPVTGDVNVSVKSSLPLFYVWGFPKNNAKTFKVKVRYERLGKEEGTKTLYFPAPQQGFTEGKAYRLPVVIEDTRIDPYDRMFNPLALVADYNINRDGTGLATTNEVPEVGVPLKEGDSGYFSLGEDHPGNFSVISDIAPSLADTYYISDDDTYFHYITVDHIGPQFDEQPYQDTNPYVADGTYIFNGTHEKCSFDWGNPTIGEVINENAVSDVNEYRYVLQAGDQVKTIYMLRYTGTNAQSAWEYRYVATKYDQDGRALNAKLVVKSVIIPMNAPMTIDDVVANRATLFVPDGVTDKVIVKEFPALGYTWTKEGVIYSDFENQEPDRPLGIDYSETNPNNPALLTKAQLNAGLKPIGFGYRGYYGQAIQYVDKSEPDFVWLFDSKHLAISWKYIQYRPIRPYYKKYPYPERTQ